MLKAGVIYHPAFNHNFATLSFSTNIFWIKGANFASETKRKQYGKIRCI